MPTYATLPSSVCQIKIQLHLKRGQVWPSREMENALGVCGVNDVEVKFIYSQTLKDNSQDTVLNLIQAKSLISETVLRRPGTILKSLFPSKITIKSFFSNYKA